MEFKTIIKEQFKEHLRKTIQYYLAQANYPVPIEVQPVVDAIVGAALLSGISLMSDWSDALQSVLPSSEVREAVEEVGKEYGYSGYEAGDENVG